MRSFGLRTEPQLAAPRFPGRVPGELPLEREVAKTHQGVSSAGWDLSTESQIVEALQAKSARYGCMRTKRTRKSSIPAAINCQTDLIEQKMLFSLADVSAALSVSQRTVETLITTNRGSTLPSLRTVRLGRRVLVPREEILRFVGRLKADAGWRTT